MTVYSFTCSQEGSFLSLATERLQILVYICIYVHVYTKLIFAEFFESTARWFPFSWKIQGLSVYISHFLSHIPFFPILIVYARHPAKWNWKPSSVPILLQWAGRSREVGCEPRGQKSHILQTVEGPRQTKKSRNLQNLRIASSVDKRPGSKEWWKSLVPECNLLFIMLSL